MSTNVSIKKFKHSLDEFHDHIRPFYRHRYVLNGHEPKYNPMAWMDSDMPTSSRGVNADLVLIFEDRGKVTGRKPSPNRPKGRPLYDSIGFSFNQDDDDPSKVEVCFSIKASGELKSGPFLSEDLFRDLLKGINRTFRNDGAPKTHRELMKALEIFWKNPEQGIEPVKPKASVLELLGDQAEKIPALHNRINLLTVRNIEDHKKIGKLNKELKVEMQECEEAKEIARLEKQIKKLRSEMKKRKSTLKDKKGITELEKATNKRDSEIRSMKDQIESTFLKLKKKVPKSGPVINELKTWFSKYMYM